MKIVIATHNKAKFVRYKEMLKHVPNTVFISLDELGIIQKVNEPYHSAQENAEHKAREYARMTGLPTLAIDEATITNFLPDHEQPGVYVRRYAGTNTEMSDHDALQYWREIFKKNPQSDKKFIWDFQIAFCDPSNNQLKLSHAVQIAHVANIFSQTIIPGYPMSSFMILEGTRAPHAELSADEKLDADKKIFHQFIQDFTEWMQS